MILDAVNVFTGKKETKEFNIREVFLHTNDKPYFQCIVKPLDIGHDTLELIAEFGSDDEIDYDEEEVRNFFNLVNTYILLHVLEKNSENKNISEQIKNAKTELNKMNKWDINLDEYVEF